MTALAITIALVGPPAVAVKYLADGAWRSAPQLVARPHGRHRASRGGARHGR